jgi:hypothetical protein
VLEHAASLEHRHRKVALFDTDDDLNLFADPVIQPEQRRVAC